MEKKLVDLFAFFAEQTFKDSVNHSKNTLITSKVDLYNIFRVSSGWQRCAPAQRLAGKAQGCFTPQQRAPSEEAAGQWAPGAPQH